MLQWRDIDSMPTNFQAQAKMTPNTQVTRLKDAPQLVPGSKKDSTGQHAISTLHAPRASSELSLPETRPLAAPLVESPVRIRTYAFVKRTFDLVLGLALLAFATPIVLVAAIAIRINTPGSPFFFQTRYGKNGKAFKIFKLRGMYIDARTRFPAYYDYSQKRDLEFCFHHEEDPRVTKAGKFIRRTSIDELPNLWNVVLGDMSLVGPRPEIPEVLALYGPYRDEYLSVKPGITCLSKITGRDRLTKRETIDFDLQYIRTRSFKADLRILWNTARSVLMRHDVF